MNVSHPAVRSGDGLYDGPQSLTLGALADNNQLKVLEGLTENRFNRRGKSGWPHCRDTYGDEQSNFLSDEVTHPLELAIG